MSRSKKIFVAIASLLIVGVTFIFGVRVGYTNGPAIDKIAGVSGKDAGTAPDDADFSTFWKAWTILNHKYIFPNKVSNQDKVWGAIQGLAASFGDPYTVFFPPEQSQMFEEDVSGNFGGAGMEIGIRDQILTVVSPLKGSPAEKAGIKSGDKILKIDDLMTNDMNTEEAVAKIRGAKGTKVTVTLFRTGTPAPFEVTIIRDTINIPTIKTTLRKDGIFVIELYSFSENSPDLFRNAMKEFIASGSSKLILDMRGNPGGYLDAAVDMASWFLPAGKVVVKEDMGDHGEGDVERSRGYNTFPNLKMVILVDGGSASASEILAGALSEHGIAQLVGEKTFGKGSVQELVPLTENTSLKITVARWLTPNGKSISEQGLSPDVKVSRTQKDYDQGKDPQLDKAVEILNK